MIFHYFCHIKHRICVVERFLNMQAIVELVKDMPKQQKLIVGLIGAFFLGKSHYYRFVRRFAIPTVTAVILYRILKTNSNSILSEINELLTKSGQSRAVNVSVGDVLGFMVCLNVLDIADKAITADFAGIYRAITDFGFGLVKNLSFVQAILQKEQDKLENDFDKELKTRSRALGQQFKTLPKTGLQGADILALMKKATLEEDLVWSSGKLSGAVYNGIPEHCDLLNQAFSLYSISNPLFPDIWPSVMKFDAEIVAMTASLVNGGLDTVCGTTSSVRISFAAFATSFKVYIIILFCQCRAAPRASSWR